MEDSSWNGQSSTAVWIIKLRLPSAIAIDAGGYYSAIANMRGESAEEVASRILACEGLGGLSGPTISPVFTRNLTSNGSAQAEAIAHSRPTDPRF